MTKDKKAKPGSAAELAEMFPAPVSIPVRVAKEIESGKRRQFVYEADTVSVSVLPLNQLGGLVDILKPLISEAGVDVMKLATEDRGTIYAAFAHATGWPVEEIGRIHPADFLSVVNAIIEVNADFFVRLLGPAVSAPPVITEGTNGDGPTPSASFAAGDTPILSVTHFPSSAPQ